jgi:hypothetical protein
MTRLQQAVVDQLSYNPKDIGNTDSELFKTLEDVNNHGAMSGFSGFTYYSETVQFVKDNRKEILANIKTNAFDFGNTALDVILSFKCLDADNIETIEAAGRFVYGGTYRDDENTDSNTVYNALAWYALEETARQLTE